MERTVNTTYSEEDLLPLAKLADLVFCPRRAAFHLLEGIWEENAFTAEGANLHERVHQAENESRGDLRIVRGLRLRSFRLGLSGVADVVEFRSGPAGVSLENTSGVWQPFPVEYKRSTLKHEPGYEVQLCAQALSLEEMLGARIESGAIFYGKSCRRQAVGFTDDLRASTEAAAGQLHELFKAGQTPSAQYGKKCRSCSLLESCMPKVTGIEKDVKRYLAKAIAED